MSGDRPAVDLGSSQVGEAQIGSVAGRDTISLADVPPRLAELLDDAREAAQRMTEALERMGDRVEFYQRTNQQAINALQGAVALLRVVVGAVVVVGVIGALIIAALVADRLLVGAALLASLAGGALAYLRIR